MCQRFRLPRLVLRVRSGFRLSGKRLAREVVHVFGSACDQDPALRDAEGVLLAGKDMVLKHEDGAASRGGITLDM